MALRCISGVQQGNQVTRMPLATKALLCKQTIDNFWTRPAQLRHLSVIVYCLFLIAEVCRLLSSRGICEQIVYCSQRLAWRNPREVGQREALFAHRSNKNISAGAGQLMDENEDELNKWTTDFEIQNNLLQHPFQRHIYLLLIYSYSKLVKTFERQDN